MRCDNLGMQRRIWRFFTRVALVLAGVPFFCACAKYGVVPPEVSNVEFYPPGPIQPGENLAVAAYIVNRAHLAIVAEAEVGSPVKLKIALNDSGQFPDVKAGDHYWVGSVKWHEGIGTGRGMPISVVCRATHGDKTFRVSKRAKALLKVGSALKQVNK